MGTYPPAPVAHAGCSVYDFLNLVDSGLSSGLLEGYSSREMKLRVPRCNIWTVLRAICISALSCCKTLQEAPLSPSDPRDTPCVLKCCQRLYTQSPVNTSNNVEATFDFVAKNGNNVERVLRWNFVISTTSNVVSTLLLVWPGLTLTDHVSAWAALSATVTYYSVTSVVFYTPIIKIGSTIA